MSSCMLTKLYGMTAKKNVHLLGNLNKYININNTNIDIIYFINNMKYWYNILYIC